VALQLPIRVRNYYGTEELARSENVSRGGICFVTEKTYEVGEILLITCPYEKAGDNIEMRGRVVRHQELQGTSRKVYGICYER
jgi:Tfp pilus assembly protein PilZ